MWGYGVMFAGVTEKSRDLAVVRRPDIPAAVMRYEEKTVPGRDGKLYTTNGEVEDIEIPIEFNFMGPPDRWFTLFRKAKKWLLRRGVQKLVLGDDAYFFYRCKKVEIGTAERVCYEIGKFTATFTCEGYNYVESGSVPHEIEDVLDNPYEVSCPIYLIEGEGACTLTVNKKSMTANVGQNLSIDTGRMLAYRSDGILQNTSVKGKYEDLYLIEGDNEISITEGFSLKVIPNWRCL